MTDKHPGTPTAGTEAALLGSLSPASLSDTIAKKLTRREVASSLLRQNRRVVPSTCHVVDKQIARAVAGLLDLDVVDGLAETWVRYREVTEARTRTKGNPTAIETVPLHRRRITSTYHPQVVITAELISHTLVFDFDVVLDIVGLAAVVQAGRVRSFEGGRSTGTARLKLHDQVLASWSFAPDLSAVVHLPGQGRHLSA